MTVEKAIEILSGFGIINRYCTEDAEALDMAIKALEQQSCEDCISRQAAIDVLDAGAWGVEWDKTLAKAMIESVPSVQPTRSAGKWIDIGDEGLVFKCSLCGDKNTIESHYCPNCGAKMTESEEEE